MRISISRSAAKSALTFTGLLLLMILASAFLSAQSKPEYQTGTIVDVKDHQPASGEEDSAKEYEISVRVGNTIYVVRYTPEPGKDVVEYKLGVSGPVLIEGDNMKFSDLLGNTKVLPIVSRKQVTAKKAKNSSAGQ